MKPLNPTFNRAIWAMAGTLMPEGWIATPYAPDTLVSLRQHRDWTGKVVVSNLHCDHTIFASPTTNVAFRAWHDHGHLALNAPFDLAGETRVYRLQCLQLIAVYGLKRSEHWRRILHAEIVAQAAYCEATGHFPEDQVAFDLQELARHV
jgi:hypothetical protein